MSLTTNRAAKNILMNNVRQQQFENSGQLITNTIKIIKHIEKNVTFTKAEQGNSLGISPENQAIIESLLDKQDRLLFLLLLLLKKVGSARLRESDIHPISLKTPAPRYHPIDRKKRKGKIVQDYSRDRAA